MSFFSLSASSSSVPNQAPIQQDTSTTQLALWKKSLSAVPAGMSSSKTSTVNVASSGRAKRGKQTLKDCQIISRSYNVMASRPFHSSKTTNQIYVATLRYDVAPLLTTSVTVPTYVGYPFILSNFSHASEYTTLFDQYRFIEIEIIIEPAYSQSAVVLDVGKMTSCIDLDDANTPTTIASVEAKQNAITTNSYTGHYHMWKPHMAVASYSGAFTSYSNVPATWIDSGSPSVQHFGLKMSCAATSAAIPLTMSVKAKIAFRQAGL